MEPVKILQCGGFICLYSRKMKVIIASAAKSNPRTSQGYNCTGLRKVVFGDRHRFRLRIVPKKTNIEYFPGITMVYLNQEQRATWGFVLNYRMAYPYCLKVNRDEFIYFNCDSLIRYSISQHRAVDKFVLPRSGWTAPIVLKKHDFQFRQIHEFPMLDATGYLSFKRNRLTTKFGS